MTRSVRVLASAVFGVGKGVPVLGEHGGARASAQPDRPWPRAFPWMVTSLLGALGACSSPSGSGGSGGGASGSSASSGSAGTSGGSARTSGGSAGTSGGSAGTSGGSAGTSSGSAGTSGGAAGSDTSRDEASVGLFSVLLNEPKLAAPAYTSVTGKVYDGKTPSELIETPLTEDSGCVVYKLTVPFCDPDCLSGVCVADDTCEPNPTAKDVGTVSISGVATSAGDKTFDLKMASNSYKNPGDLPLEYPGFSAGDPITLSASGGDYSAFTITAKGVEPLTLGRDDYELTKGSPLDLSWNTPSSASAGRVQVEVNLTHHGGSTGYISCDVADSGSLTISTRLIERLIDLGVAGYPTLSVTRSSRGATTIAPGTVVLTITSKITRTISVLGYLSCTTDDDCQSTGNHCDKDVRLCK